MAKKKSELKNIDTSKGILTQDEIDALLTAVRDAPEIFTPPKNPFNYVTNPTGLCSDLREVTNEVLNLAFQTKEYQVIEGVKNSVNALLSIHQQLKK